MTDWLKLTSEIQRATAKDLHYQSHTPLAGGSINQAYLLRCESTHYFVKFNHAQQLEMFVAEFEALQEMQQCRDLHTPEPVCYGRLDHQSYLVLEYIELYGQGNDYQLGQNLAKMHQITRPQHGWHRDNTIGSTVQYNRWSDDWSDFWKEQRLLPQLEMLYQKGYRSTLQKPAQELLSRLDDIFADHQPQASLLHGDLWSGNYGFDASGQGVIFDPALYYGDRETDLAMTRLFGGFRQEFYQGYQDQWPLADSFQQRKDLYNLYHILNHANLFGSSYLHQALNILDVLLQ